MNGSSGGYDGRARTRQTIYSAIWYEEARNTERGNGEAKFSMGTNDNSPSGEHLTGIRCKSGVVQVLGLGPLPHLAEDAPGNLDPGRALAPAHDMSQMVG